MSYQTIPLLAGIPHTLDIAGVLLLIDSPGAAGAVDVALIKNGTPGVTMAGRKGGFRHVGAFDGVQLTSATATTVTLFLSFEDVNLGTNQLEISNSPENPVNVLFGGTVAPVMGTVKVENALVTITHIAPVLVGLAATALISDATQKKLRIRNGHASAVVGIGGAGVTLANAAIQLQPGDVWAEDDAAGAAWYAVSDTADTSVQVMGIK